MRYNLLVLVKGNYLTKRFNNLLIRIEYFIYFREITRLGDLTTMIYNILVITIVFI